MTDLQSLSVAVRASRGFAQKRDIADVLGLLGKGATSPVALGDDCAALPDGDGYLLFAIEGLIEDFVSQKPWFAGYCGVMVNVSDIYAMGGRPIAVVDALWSRGLESAAAVLAGLAAAAERYGVPLVGGHSNNRSSRGQLAVAILGRARRLISSFAARPGDRLLMAVDLRGSYEEPYAYFNASSHAPAARLRADLDVLPRLAESELCAAGKDISMAGILGTVLMLLECSQVGAYIDVDAIPRPVGTESDEALLRWLTAFPSYGFVLSVSAANTAAVLAEFERREIAAAIIGEVQDTRQLMLRQAEKTATLWDLGVESFIGAGGAHA
jgi:AIR synthase-related protein